MKRKMNSHSVIYKSIVLAFALLLSRGLFVSGQNTPGFTEALERKFTEYCNSFPREEMYVHTDREEYVAGEDLWLAAYLFDGKTATLSGGSSLAYIEILNPENRPVVQKRIRLENGTGPGNLELPDSLSTGTYCLRAYTGWMKNFLPDNCFMKPVYITNALSGKKYNSVWPAASQPTESEVRNVTGISGLYIRTGRDSSGNVVITVNSTGSYRTKAGSALYLFIRTHGVINMNRQLSLPDNFTEITIPRDQLSPGINHITLFSLAGRPVFEKLMYTPAEAPVFLNADVASVAATRQEVGVEIENKSSATGIKKLSISVSPGGGRYFPGIDDYMLFGSEFGVIPEKLYKALGEGMSPDSIDVMMSGLRSSWIDWNTVLSSRKPEIRYAMEKTAHYLYGHLLNKSTLKPDSGQVLFLSFPGKNAGFRYAVTDKDGCFRFELPVDHHFRDLVIQPEDNTRGNNIRLESPFSEKYPPLMPADSLTPAYEPPAGSKLAINYQVTRIYGSDQAPDTTEAASFVRGKYRFYGTPDIELVLADYIKLPVMHEVFFELMPGVFMKERKGIYDIYVHDIVDNRPYDRPTILLVDGVVVKDPAVIAGLDPELVERIDAVKSRYFIGEYLFFGLVNVITKAGDFSDVPLPDQAIRFPWQAFARLKSFSAPDYDDAVLKNSRVPDFRNTLYWNPSVSAEKETSAGVKFWTSDFRGPFEVLVQGVTERGESFSLRKAI
ncbi:MAG TPA: hypothetical protein PK172_08705, partial [Bacteroidales bacterium]|nr:hypothetical protein [Bacteroidales bacterium]